MATQTTNYGLTKPSYNETADIGVINSNMDIIDAKMKAIENKAGSGGGSGNTDTYGHVKVGSVTIDASGDDTIELVAGSNVTLTPDTTSKSVTISADSGGGGGTSDYLQLSNKPKINGVELVNNITTEDLGIVVPQYTSELVNDSGFITNETDPTVPAWAKEPNKPTYTAEEVGALPSNTPIPDPTSVVVDRFVSVGTHIADISVNGEKTELYAPTGGGGTSVTVDSELSTTSENPVQNKVITQALNEKSNLISDAWNASTTYEVGQYCIYNNSLWKCLVQHSGQTPTEGTYWTNVTVADEITSVNNSLQETNNRLNYSTDEQIIGTWIDGKPIYRKTYIFSYGRNVKETPYYLDRNVSVDCLINAYGSQLYIGTNQPTWYSFPYMFGDSVTRPEVGSFGIRLALTGIFLNSTVNSLAKYTFEYTKTTD